VGVGEGSPRDGHDCMDGRVDLRLEWRLRAPQELLPEVQERHLPSLPL